MKEILKKIDLVQSKIEELQKKGVERISVGNVYYDCDVLEMLELGVKKNLKGKLNRYNGIMGVLYSLEWEVSEHLTVVFWSKEGQVLSEEKERVLL